MILFTYYKFDSLDESRMEMKEENHIRIVNAIVKNVYFIACIPYTRNLAWIYRFSSFSIAINFEVEQNPVHL